MKKFLNGETSLFKDAPYYWSGQVKSIVSWDSNPEIGFTGMPKLYMGTCLVMDIKTSPKKGLQYISRLQGW